MWKYELIKKIAPFIPEKVRTRIREYVDLSKYDIARRKAANPFLNLPEEHYPESPYLFGIIEDVAQYHKYYIAACREMKLSYKVLNILSNSWVSKFCKSGCDVFLVWPTSISTVYKGLFDYRLYILEKELEKIVFPSWKECWLTEHKPRLRDWLDAHDLPHPETWVFYQQDDAENFAQNAPIPIVVKTATGASASGIQIVRSRNKLRKIIRKAFGKGLRPRSFEPNDKQRGFVYLQRYLPDVDEWRMVRIGDSFFGYRKEKGPSGLHSASHAWSWLDPGPELLNLTKKVTELGNFRSMDVDIFLTKEEKLLINECQTTFGCSTPAIQMKINNVEGRYVWKNHQWQFEPGSFCANHMCNLRLEYVQQLLNKGIKNDK